MKIAAVQTERERMTDQNNYSNDNSSAVKKMQPSKSGRRTWIWIALVGIVIIAAVIAAVVLLRENGSPSETAETDPLNFAEVVITDLIQEMIQSQPINF